jgi:hypothetical protein
MATIQLTAYPIASRTPRSTAIILSLGGGTPQKRIECRTLADVEAAMAAYGAELLDAAKADGKAYQISPMVVNGRAPSGFNKAENALKFDVNPEAVPMRPY